MADRMMAVLEGCSGASPKERLSKLINDAGLPADIRMAVAQKVFSDRTGLVRQARPEKSEIPIVGRASVPVEIMSQAARDALLAIVSDASASAKARRTVALKLATHFLPKKPVNKRWQFTADECGFAINAEIAREYRAIDFELRDLKRHRNRDFPEIAQRIRKLQAKIDAILPRLQCPCPTRYGEEQIAEDIIRLAQLARKREAGIALSTEEDAEEAHRKARFDSYMEGRERKARRCREVLEQTNRLFRMGRLSKLWAAPPLSRKQRNELWLLRWLYPPDKIEHDRDPEAEARRDAALADGYSFGDEMPAADGNFYPHDSKLRPAIDDEPVIIEEYAHIPPYCILTPGQPPEFTYELRIYSVDDKSGPSTLRLVGPKAAEPASC